MRTGAACSSIALLAACSVPSLDLAGKQCPCDEAGGYVCDMTRNVCVLTSPAKDGGPPGGDGGHGNDGSPTNDGNPGIDGSRSDGAPPIDSGPPPVPCGPNGLIVCSGTCVDSQNNPADCGACGHDCLGGMCVRGKCQPFMIATNSGLGGGFPLAVDATSVYWGDTVSVSKCSITGCGGAPPVVLATNLNNPTVYAVAASFVYVTVSGAGGIGGVSKIPVGGGSVTPLSVGQPQPTAVVVDPANVYWVDDALTNGSVQSCPITGCPGGPHTIASGLTTPTSLAVDSNNAYFTAGSVFSCPLSGCTTPMTITSSGQPQGVILVGGALYWIDGLIGAIESCPVTGCSGAPTMVAIPRPVPTILASDGTYLYWLTPGAMPCGTPTNDGSIVRCPLSACSSAEETLLAGQAYLGGLVLDATSIYWSQYTSIMRLAK